MKVKTSKPEDPAIIIASEKIEQFQDSLKDNSYERLLSRAKKFGHTPSLYLKMGKKK